MSDIRNITLAFPCRERLERNAAGEFYCHKCAHAIIDFRCQSAEALQEVMRQAGSRPVCGIFKNSQLSEKFARYAAAAAIAVTAASATMCSTEETATPKPASLPEKDSFVPDQNVTSLDSVAFESDTVFTVELESDIISTTIGIVFTDPNATDLEADLKTDLEVSIRNLNQSVFPQNDDRQAEGNNP